MFNIHTHSFQMVPVCYTKWQLLINGKLTRTRQCQSMLAGFNKF